MNRTVSIPLYKAPYSKPKALFAQLKVRPHYRIVLIYLILGCSWIYFSDAVLDALISSKTTLTYAQNIKGWAFIVITAAMLLVLIRRAVKANEKVNLDLIASYDQTIHGWMELMDIRHQETRNHTQRVTNMTVKFAQIAGITDADSLKIIERGAALHDMGKIGIADNILIKPGKLTEEEWQQMRMHPEIAHQVLSKINFLRPSIDIPYSHHERWDGTGYPLGLKEEAIPLAARIFSIIDVWDALSNKRVYKDAWPEQKVLDYIRSQAGAQFDPRLTQIFLEHYREIVLAG